MFKKIQHHVFNKTKEISKEVKYYKNRLSTGFGWRMPKNIPQISPQQSKSLKKHQLLLSFGSFNFSKMTFSKHSMAQTQKQHFTDSFSKAIADTYKKDPHVTIIHQNLDIQKQFHLHSDNQWGGLSSCRFFKEGQLGIFEGNLDLTIPERPSNLKPIKQSGFCAFKTISFPENNWLDLSNYDTIEMKINTYGRKFLFVLEPYSFMRQNQWVYALQSQNELKYFSIPFDDFLCTYQGEWQQYQFGFEKEHIQNFGFTMSERKEGPFRLDIEWIRAVDNSSEEPEDPNLWRAY